MVFYKNIIGNTITLNPKQKAKQTHPSHPISLVRDQIQTHFLGASLKVINCSGINDTNKKIDIGKKYDQKFLFTWLAFSRLNIFGNNRLLIFPMTHIHSLE